MALRIRHALIMAAGRGRRMAPLTDSIPKPMAPYRGSTLIGVAIDKIRPLMQRIHVTVGYQGAMLAQHVVERGVDGVFNTEGHGNAWWLYHTVMAGLDAPVFVLTGDNVTDIDFSSLEADYFASAAPPCLIVPVRPVAGVDGDYITHEDLVVTAIGRQEPTDLYGSGIQIVNPARINQLCPGGDSFYDVWQPLIEQRRLRVSRVMPERWFSVDTLADLERLR
jgi:NDP-sugar pyrophosphorylase family protein